MEEIDYEILDTFSVKITDAIWEYFENTKLTDCLNELLPDFAFGVCHLEHSDGHRFFPDELIPKGRMENFFVQDDLFVTGLVLTSIRHHHTAFDIRPTTHVAKVWFKPYEVKRVEFYDLGAHKKMLSQSEQYNKIKKEIKSNLFNLRLQ